MSGDDQSDPASAQQPTMDGGPDGSWTEGNRVIGAAVGITMTRYGMSYADAFRFLRDLAASHRRGLLDLARTVTASRWPVAGPFVRARDGSPVGRLAHSVEESTAGRLLDLLVETRDLNDLLAAVADLAVESIPTCDFASITVIRHGAPATVASSDARAARVDEVQYSGGQGPCLQAARSDEVVEVHDLSRSERHSASGGWRREAVDVGVRAVLALPIASDADVAAALNLYTSHPGPWPAEAQAIAEDLAIYTGDAITLAFRHGDPVNPVNRV
jgi:hypothetical protein